MELELKRKELFNYVPLKGQLLTAEETVEFILSDYCADAGRIISWHTESAVTDKRVSESGFEVAGTVFVTVLYVGMDSEGLRSCRIKVPFSVRQEMKEKIDFLAVHSGCESCECRLINARKILCRCRVGVSAVPYEAQCQKVCCDLSVPEETALEMLWQKADAVFLAGQWEKEFTFMDAVALRSGSEADEVLFSRAVPRVGECRLCGTKVMVKGEMDIFALCRGEDGGYLTASGSAPFAQMCEIPQGMEEAEYEASAEVADHTAALISEGGVQKAEAQMMVRLTLRAKKTGRERYLADLYGTNCETETETELVTLAENHRFLHKKQELRLTPAAGLKPQSIICAEGCCGVVQRLKEGNTLVLRTSVTVKVLYLDETSAPALAQSSQQCELRLEMGEDASIFHEKACAARVSAVMADNGIECRAEVDFSFEHRLLRRMGAVVAVKTEPLKNENQRPSVAVRRMEAGDTLWKLAKGYRTTVSAIEKANGGALKKGDFLLIPKARA